MYKYIEGTLRIFHYLSLCFICFVSLALSQYIYIYIGICIYIHIYIYTNLDICIDMSDVMQTLPPSCVTASAQIL